MVESLKELNNICQKPRYREVGNWMVRHILRDAALPVTWLLLHTRVTADQITVLSLVIGAGGIALFAFPSSGAFLLGALLLQLWYYLDHVDGQIARYRKTSSLTGRFFDFVAHHLIHGAVFFGLGVFCYQSAGKAVFPLIWGWVTSTAVMMLNLAHDAKYKTFFEAILAGKRWEVVAPGAAEEPKCGEGRACLVRRAVSVLHKSSEIHVLMNVLTVSAVVPIVLHWSIDLRVPVFWYYGIVVPFLAAGKIAHWIIARKIDADFKARLRELPPQ